MAPEIIAFVTEYGYFAIFLLVFSQEIGIPNPVPNELVLLFSGYLTYTGILSLPLVIATAVAADFIGTNILYFLFYFFGKFILRHKPRWLPISEKKIAGISHRIVVGGMWRVYLGRITPFIRGYTSVITGLLQIKPIVFLPVAFISGITWAACLSLAGRLLGPYWSHVGVVITQIRVYVLIIVAMAVLAFVFRFLKKKRFERLSES